MRILTDDMDIDAFANLAGDTTEKAKEVISSHDKEINNWIKTVVGILVSGIVTFFFPT